ncbi:MAG: glutamate synthase-related protein [bacterium]
MPKKYHIPIKPTPGRFPSIGRFYIIEQDQYCLHCPTNSCVKYNCAYGVYKERRFDSKEWKDTIDYLCKNCFRCIQECKAKAISKTKNPEYLQLGDDYWKPGIITSLWYQAETGKIPVSGAGYRGPFVGPGFDEMWTDMSEIVRPTRDGIHGREYIATNIDLGRKLPSLRFDPEGGLLSTPFPSIDLPMPIIFNPLPFGALSENVTLAMAKAAKTLGIMMVVNDRELSPSLIPYREHLIPCLNGEGKEIKGSKAVEFPYRKGCLSKVKELKAKNPEAVALIKVILNKEAKRTVLELTKTGAEIIHLSADINGHEFEENPSFIKDAIRKIHTQLVEEGIRDEVTLIVSGGIAQAEHLAKIMLCGADGCAIDLPLLIALECRLCKRCVKGLSCPVEIDSINPDWGARRIVNLMGAWHSQLIEVMGAMGIREARRLRGETGRAMFYEDMERERFGELFGKRSR